MEVSWTAVILPNNGVGPWPAFPPASWAAAWIEALGKLSAAARKATADRVGRSFMFSLSYPRSSLGRGLHPQGFFCGARCPSRLWYLADDAPKSSKRMTQRTLL